MKKLFVFILIMMVAFQTVATAADIDPIVGCWYAYLDINASPEMVSVLGSFDKMISIYEFKENGSVMCLELNESNDQGTPLFNVIGKWEKENGKYTYSIIALGEGDAYLEESFLFLGIPGALANLSDTEIYMKLRRLEYFNPYSDYIFQR